MLLIMIFVALMFFLSGMLTSAIYMNRAEERPSHWSLYAFAWLNFMFGLYYLITLVGAVHKI